jgi:hypothetical protein
MQLGEYIEQLVAMMRESEPDAYERLRRVVGLRQAHIGLDAERVAVYFVGGNLAVRSVTAGDASDGEGFTDNETVLDLLESRIEASAAIRSGRVEVRGTTENVDRLFVAIEILIDVSTRTPSIQRLSERFRSEFSRRTPPLTSRDPSWYPSQCSPQEYEMLARLDLLPE